MVQKFRTIAVVTKQPSLRITKNKPRRSCEV